MNTRDVAKRLLESYYDARLFGRRCDVEQSITSLSEVIGLVVGAIDAVCRTEDGTALTSWGRAENADLLRTASRLGLVEITASRGNSVRARWLV